MKFLYVNRNHLNYFEPNSYSEDTVYFEKINLLAKEIEKNDKMTEEEKKKKEEEKENLIKTLLNLCDFEYQKKNIKSRKVLLNIRKGCTKTEIKNSLKRDKNNTLIQQFFNLISKTGNKESLFTIFNIMVENFFFTFCIEKKEFNDYKNYKIHRYLYKYILDYSDFYNIFINSLEPLETMFEIKTKKNDKSLKSDKKYRHEIIYISKSKRKKNSLKNLNAYSESFKNYEFWERLFWVFINLTLNPENSIPLKKKYNVYKKAMKFLKNKKNSNKK